MIQDKAHRLDALASQLTESLMTVVICADEIRAIAREGVDDEPKRSRRYELEHGLSSNKQRPLIDESTLSVIWNGQKLRLGNTRAFRLLAMLARRPNQYVTHSDLLHEVWDDEELATSTIRSVVRDLRRRLRGGGMHDLADTIRGHNGRYILEL